MIYYTKPDPDTRYLRAFVSHSKDKAGPFPYFPSRFLLDNLIHHQHHETRRRHRIIRSGIGSAYLCLCSRSLSNRSGGGIIAGGKRIGVVAVQLLCRGGVNNLRTSHIAALLQSCTSFPFSQSLLFVSPELSPVIAIRFDFPSFL